MRIVSHNDQALVVAMLGCLLARFALLGDTALCSAVTEQTLVWLGLIEVFACIGVWLVSFKYDGLLLACHYLGAQVLFLLLVHPFPFHAQWTFLPLWLSAVLLYLAWSFQIECIPLYYRTMGAYEGSVDSYLRILNVANAICVNDVNVRSLQHLPASVAALNAFKVTEDDRGRVTLAPVPITSAHRGDGSGSSGHYSSADDYGSRGEARRRRSSFDFETENGSEGSGL